MKFTGYELIFNTAVHFGRQKLDDSEHMIYADTIFSALCHEALKLNGEEGLQKLIDLVDQNRLRFSDAFPFNKSIDGKRYYIPKPMIEIKHGDEGDSSVKKELKKLECIPWDKMTQYIDGKLDIREETELYKTMGKSEIRTMASVEEGKDTTPFSVGAYTFNADWGLYVIIGYEDEADNMFIGELLMSLGYSGIGGKKSSGMGKFTTYNAKIPEELLEGICIDGQTMDNYMALSVSMPEDNELEQIMRNSRYALLRRGGFISSGSYANRQVKKKETYIFKSGSVFKTTFEGTLRDVSGEGNHPVYRYAKPIFLEVK